MFKKVLILSVLLPLLGLPLKLQADVIHGKENAIRSIRDNFMARKAEFAIDLDKNTLMKLLDEEDLLNAAALDDDPADSGDGDYLKANVISWTASWSVKGPRANIEFTADYRTSLAQEAQLEQELAASLAALDMDNATEFKKVKAIHDYIIGLASYDQTLTRYSAYDLFEDKAAVCLGYAAAAYRMFTDAGIESRIIAGYADFQEHVWNIVKVEGNWYNIDLTWDDPILPDGGNAVSYDFFLKNEEDFKDHVRAAEYSTQEFLKSYKLADTSFTAESFIDN